MLFAKVRRAAVAAICVLLGHLAQANIQEHAGAELDSKIKRLMGQYSVPGSSVALVRKGEVVWSKSYGMADTEGDVPVNGESVFQVASVSKSVTAWGVMKLVEQGKLELDVPVESYLTRWQLPPSPFDNSQVTVRRLLSHTAGTSVGGYLGKDPAQPLPTLEQNLSGKGVLMGDVRVVQEPGSSWSYSGGGYTLLQLLIEEVTRQSFSDFMQREVLTPLGMRKSSFARPPMLLENLATGHDWWGKPVPNYKFRAEAAASMLSTTEDMARFVAASMPGPNGEPIGRGVLARETVELMLKAAPATDTAFGGLLRNGLGYMLVPGETTIGFHGGDNQGWEAIVLTLPDMQEGIVILSNSDRASTFGYQLDLLSAWSRQIAGDPLRSLYQSGAGMRDLQYKVALALVLVLIIYMAWVAAGLRAGRRRLALEFTRRRVVRITLLASAIGLWWIFWYSGLGKVIVEPDLPEHFRPVVALWVPWPTAFIWISWALTFWGFGLIASGFAPAAKRSFTSQTEGETE
ncbi:beta-lactamase family protein [Pseudomaricurvus alkylphenolicus]|uniref:serine hydrolase domain-containing protein n=1 Tax=Pseudomaricurvus alkylphenolicus TaxID=1306991 RepID=UPI00141F2F58|nr:serine hydrolase domain-containing protein [Pseudomaricurvus alkylphenolicus]NIB38473.1 beta-lactamase family protein [Pseudomaricurvus alkylphenolicus]